MSLSPTRKLLAAGIAAFAALSGWADPVRAGLFSTTGPVIAMLGGDLFLGEAEGRLGGSGTVWIQSRTSPEVTCRGHFSYNAESGGAGTMLCSDGASVTFRFLRLSITRGHGTGNSTRGPLTFTYGLSAAESEPYLRPAGFRP